MTLTDDAGAAGPDLTQRIALLEQQIAALRGDHAAAAARAAAEDAAHDRTGRPHKTDRNDDDRWGATERRGRRDGRSARDRFADTTRASGLPTWAVILLAVLAAYGAIQLLDGLHLFRHIDLF